MASIWRRKEVIIAGFTLAAIAVHLVLRFVVGTGETLHRGPLFAVFVVGGGPLVFELLVSVARREFGADLLAGLAIVTSLILGEYLAGALVVLMLSGGAALEAYAVRNASSVLEALARRMPTTAHRKSRSRLPGGTEGGGDVIRETGPARQAGPAEGDAREAGGLDDVPLDRIEIGDVLVVLPHEICPVDGTVLDGHGVMDESYLTGEPYVMSKVPGSAVLSGAINGETALTIRADKRPVDSRYARIMDVMRTSAQQRPRLRRLGDQLGAWYTPLAVSLALAAWAASGEAVRFLAVLVVATPCPLLIAIPVAIIGSISLAARRGIIIKDPAVLEMVATCRTIIFDKTGTLTYGEPRLTAQFVAPDFDRSEALALAASLERYSKHPLAAAVLAAAESEGVRLAEAASVSERPGEGLTGTVAGRGVTITSRKKLLADQPAAAADLPPVASGLECVVLIDGQYAATYQFRDEPRREGASFVTHLAPRHRFERILLVSGDRESEVRYLADRVGIDEVYAGQSPEDKLEIVRRETARARTVFLGDGINDAPALTAATVGLAFGQHSDVTTEAAGAVILDSSLERADEFLHISRRMRRIALQSAVGGMALSVAGMLVAAAGYLPPVAGALVQEAIDVLAIANALRVAVRPRVLSDIEEPELARV